MMSLFVRIFTVLTFLFVFSLSAGEELLLWEAKHPALPGKLYLAGSIHFGLASFYPLDAAYDKALEQSDVMVFEIYDRNNQEAPLVMSFIQRRAFYPSGKTLSSVMGKQSFDALTRYYRSKGLFMDPRLLEQKRPWFITLEMTQLFAAQMKFDPAMGFEAVFKANMGKRPGIGLENGLAQLSMLESTSERTLCRIIMESVHEENKDKMEFEAIVDGLLTGKTENLSVLSEKLALRHPDFYKRLIADRNRNMTSKLFGLSKQNKTFFVLIGALHFSGRDSILLQLEKLGFLVIQIKASNRKGNLKPTPQ